MDTEKFMSLEAAKRDRIISAAMNEFRYGYAKASTDTIVQKAGISKGLLYHYFGTKEGLYSFLVSYAVDLMKKDYFDMMDLGQRDILEGFWQISLLRRDISERYPEIYDFLYGVYAYKSDIPNVEISEMHAKSQKTIEEDLFARCDTQLFREDVDPKKALAIISWTMDGFFDAFRNGDLTENHNFEQFLEELRGFLDILRLCFYKR